MDNFMNLAKQGLAAYEGGQNQNQNQNDSNVQGGAQYNSPHHSQKGGGYQPSGGQQNFQQGQGQKVGPDVDADEAIQAASNHAGDAGDTGLFSQAMGFLHQNSDQHTQPVNEQHVQNAHDQAYNQGNASSLGADSLGSAAAMQVLKQFTGGGGGDGGGNSQTQLISMAMGEAAKLFESQGSASGSKQDAVNSAGMTIMKLMVQSKFGGGIMGGGNSGGLSMLSMVSKFM